MSLLVSFELDDDDLNHFRLIMRSAREALGRKTPEEIVEAARSLLRDIGDATMPGFIRDRIDNLRLLIEMLTDLDWRMAHEEATRVLSALAYFTEPEDLIPDQIPGLGFLDDAIMVELVVRELQYEIEAYREFCDYRKQGGGVGRRGGDKESLSECRDRLQARMRLRRDQDLGQTADPGLIRLFD
jgi:uncharacterized membrane protein YkvA (DUF1232 family)